MLQWHPALILPAALAGSCAKAGVLVEGVDGGDVLGQDRGEGGGVGHVGSLVRACLLDADDSTVDAPYPTRPSATLSSART
jgi:hypothetical protein